MPSRRAASDGFRNSVEQLTDHLVLADRNLMRAAPRARSTGSSGNLGDQVYFLTSSITLPSLGRLPGLANSTLPPTLHTVRMVPSSTFSRSAEGDGASTLRVITSAW